MGGTIFELLVMTKRFLIILVMVSWCNTSFAECIKGDCKNGYGTFKWPDGSTYTGGWSKGLWHGQATVKYADGSIYTGGWSKGLAHGQATITYANGEKYVGEWRKNKKHGNGTFTWSDGSAYVGKFKNDLMHGQGTITYADGSILVAEFKKGEPVKTISIDTSAKEEADKKIELVSMIGDAKKTCKKLGFTEGTDKFADCSLKLYSQSVELAAKNNQTVVMQPQSSGSNTMTIYDPVRDSRALIRQGQRMLSGACTLGINC